MVSEMVGTACADRPHVAVRGGFASIIRFVSIVIVAVSSVGAQEIPADLLKYMNDSQVRYSAGESSRVNEIISKYKKNKEEGDEVRHDDSLEAQNEGSFEEETGSAAEDMSSERSGEELSVYEKMVRGTTIHPDHILSDLKVFGHEVFSKSTAPSLSSNGHVSVPANYPIGSGDEIVILLWGRINEEYRLTVDRDGKIKIPRLGPVSVRGLPFSAAQKNIVDRMQTIEGVQASVTMGELRSIQIYVVGEVKTPGMYTVSALTNITNALFSAGGPKPDGSLRNIQLKRNGKTVAKIDFYDFLLRGANKTTIRLRPGDVIFVPVATQMAAIAGNVRRSAFYELERKTSLSDLIELAGGITPAAWVNRIQIERFEENKYQVVLDLTAEVDRKIPNVEINDGDVVKIFPVVIKDQNAVYLSGNVLRPGKYEYSPDMKVGDLLPNREEILPETYFRYAIIRRRPPPHFKESIIPFDLGLALEDPASSENLQLEPLDEVIVYHRDFFEPDRSVSIGGAVTTPLTTELLQNMTVRDLVIKAGGLREDASPSRGELYRRKLDGDFVSTERISFCVECALEDDPGHNLVLQKSDRVFIRQKKGWEDERTVELQGEVVFPGSYVLLEGETLGDLIERAGGFTEEAYLEAAVLTRNSVKELERRRMQDYIQRLENDMMKLSGELVSKEKPDEAQAIIKQQAMLRQQLQEIEPVGRVVVDLEREQEQRKLILENGDQLLVPKQKNTVSVFGEVFNPSTFTLDDRNLEAKHYIQLAGGYKEHANKRDVYIIKANGSVRTKRMVRINSYELSPGDAIVVPQRIRYVNGFKLFMDAISSIVQVSSLVILATTAVNALK